MSSPIRGRPSTATTRTIRTSTVVTSTRNFSQNFLDQRDQAAMAIDFKRLQLQNEDLTNNLIAANTKLLVLDDRTLELHKYKCMFEDSEDARAALQ